MDLQTAFYIIGIVFMSIMLLIMVTLVIVAFVIKAKIHAIQQRIEDKLAIVTNIAHVGGEVLGTAKKAFKRR